MLSINILLLNIMIDTIINDRKKRVNRPGEGVRLGRREVIRRRADHEVIPFDVIHTLQQHHTIYIIIIIIERRCYCIIPC